MTWTPRTFGRDDCIAVLAIRHCLSRQPNKAADCVEWLEQQWRNLEPITRDIIARDIDEALKRDYRARTTEDPHAPLGREQDRKHWEHMRNLLRNLKRGVVMPERRERRELRERFDAQDRAIRQKNQEGLMVQERKERLERQMRREHGQVGRGRAA